MTTGIAEIRQRITLLSRIPFYRQRFACLRMMEELSKLEWGVQLLFRGSGHGGQGTELCVSLLGEERKPSFVNEDEIESIILEYQILENAMGTKALKETLSEEMFRRVKHRLSKGPIYDKAKDEGGAARAAPAVATIAGTEALPQP